MSIIERVGQLLVPAAGKDSESSPPRRDQAEVPDMDVVKRSVGEQSNRTDAIRHHDMVERPDDSRSVSKLGPFRTLSSDALTRTIWIDPERLRSQNLILADGKRTAISEAFRRVKRKVLSNMAEPKPGVPANLVMVTSSVPGEGKSFCALNLALSIALEMDHTVLLVDGDVARPAIPMMLGIKAQKGLMDLLLDRQTRLSDVLCKTNIGKLIVLPAGTLHRHATEALASGAMRALLGELSRLDPNRIVVFDSPPLMVASEASVLASQMGQVIVVVEAGKTPEPLLKNALGRIESANIVGVLLNKCASAGLWDAYGEYGYDAT